ncbi:hypothetical protein GCM10027051_13720 [Niabella terrae]
MTEYKFTYYTGKGLPMFLKYLLGPFFVLLPLSMYLLQWISWIFWISIPLMILSIITGIRKLMRIVKAQDCIQLDDTGFDSAVFGRVSFTDIESIPPYNALQVPPPSMRIRLKNGRKIYWHFNNQDGRSSTDVAVFSAFRDQLFTKLSKQMEKSLVSAEAHPQADPVISTAISPLVVEQLQSHKKREINYKYIAIPFSLLLGILAVVRGCGEDWARERNQQSIQHIRNGMRLMEQEYQDNLAKSREVISDYSRRLGPVYLLTNDPDGALKYLPDIREPYSVSSTVSIAGFSHMEENEILEKVIARPDSFDYELVVYSEPINCMMKLQAGIFSAGDSSTAEIYLAAYNPDKEMESRLRSRMDSSFQPIQYTSSVAIPRTGKLNKRVFSNMSFASVRSLLQYYDGTYFYLALKGTAEVDERRFKEVCQLVLDDFKQGGIDTKDFRTGVFNQ